MRSAHCFFAAAAACVFAASPAGATALQWTGSNFGTAANWNPAQAPSAADDVTIAGGVTAPVVRSAISVGNVTCDPASSMRIAAPLATKNFNNGSGNVVVDASGSLLIVGSQDIRLGTMNAVGSVTIQPNLDQQLALLELTATTQLTDLNLNGGATNGGSFIVVQQGAQLTNLTIGAGAAGSRGLYLLLAPLTATNVATTGDNDACDRCPDVDDNNADTDCGDLDDEPTAKEQGCAAAPSPLWLAGLVLLRRRRR